APTSERALPASTPGASKVRGSDRSAQRGLSPKWFWTSAALTATLGAGATVVGILALSESNEFSDPKTTATRRAELASRGPDLALATDALLIGTGVAAGVTLYLFFKTDFAVTPTPGGVAVAGRF